MCMRVYMCGGRGGEGVAGPQASSPNPWTTGIEPKPMDHRHEAQTSLAPARPSNPELVVPAGVGITEKTSRVVEEVPDKDESGAASRPVWEDIGDPTERLALALDLDLSRLAIYTGQLTTDATG